MPRVRVGFFTQYSRQATTGRVRALPLKSHRPYGAELMLLHVMKPASATGPYAKVLEAKVQHDLEAFVWPPDLSVRTIVEYGEPVKTILHFAAVENVDSIRYGISHDFPWWSMQNSHAYRGPYRRVRMPRPDLSSSRSGSAFGWSRRSHNSFAGRGADLRLLFSPPGGVSTGSRTRWPAGRWGCPGLVLQVERRHAVRAGGAAGGAGR